MDTDRAHSMLMGMAIGDALGATVEFQSPASIRAAHGELRDIVGGGWLHLAPGETTDDTQMAMCLVRSLEDAGGYSTRAAVARYLQWMRSGPPDVGATISSVLRRVEEGASPATATAAHHRTSGGRSAGNGSLMRCWPLVAAYVGAERDEALRLDSKSTHYDPLAADACVFAGRLCEALSRGAGLETASGAAGEGLSEEVLVAAGSDRERAAQRSEEAMGFVLTGLAVGCAALDFDDPEEGLIWAVNLGGDADTNGAIAGALLGAGGATWPTRWSSVVDVRTEIDEASARLCERRFAAPIGWGSTASGESAR